MDESGELVISRPAQVRALASGVRSAIVETLLLGGAMAVREAAERLSRSPESLYHHLRVLERAGIVRVVEVRRVGRTKEAVYGLVATALRLDRSNSSVAMRRARGVTASAMLGRAARRARRGIERGLDEGSEGLRRVRVETLIVPLDAAALEAVHRALDRVMAELRGARARLGVARLDEAVGVTIALTPATLGSAGGGSGRGGRRAKGGVRGGGTRAS